MIQNRFIPYINILAVTTYSLSYSTLPFRFSTVSSVSREFAVTVTMRVNLNLQMDWELSKACTNKIHVHLPVVPHFSCFISVGESEYTSDVAITILRMNSEKRAHCLKPGVCSIVNINHENICTLYCAIINEIHSH